MHHLCHFQLWHLCLWSSLHLWSSFQNIAKLFNFNHLFNCQVLNICHLIQLSCPLIWYIMYFNKNCSLNEYIANIEKYIDKHMKRILNIMFLLGKPIINYSVKYVINIWREYFKYILTFRWIIYKLFRSYMKNNDKYYILYINLNYLWRIMINLVCFFAYSKKQKSISNDKYIIYYEVIINSNDKYCWEYLSYKFLLENYMNLF